MHPCSGGCILLVAVHDLGRLDVTLFGLEQGARLGLARRSIWLAFLLRGLNEEVLMLAHDALLLGHEPEDVRPWDGIRSGCDRFGALALDLAHHTALLDH